MEDFFDILKYILPSIITGGVAAFFLKQYVRIESNKQKFEILNKKKEQSLPIRLQAYERMTLFLDRISLFSIINRIDPRSSNKIEYAKMLINQINSEYDHNLVQQIYVSEECWALINNTKTTVLNNITAYSMKDSIKTGKELQQELQKLSLDGIQPSQIAQQFIQQEVQNIL